MHFDYIVIGSGSGNSAAGTSAGRITMRVATTSANADSPVGTVGMTHQSSHRCVD